MCREIPSLPAGSQSLSDPNPILRLGQTLPSNRTFFMQLPGFHLVGGAAGFTSPGSKRNYSKQHLLGLTHGLGCAEELWYGKEPAAKHSSTCSPVPAHVLVSNTILGSGSRPLPEGLLLARIGGPDPTFLPEQLLKIFKARRTKTTDFLHFGNLLSRCGEDGSGVSKASSAAALPDAEASADETRRSCWTWLFGGGFGCGRMLGARWSG